MMSVEAMMEGKTKLRKINFLMKYRESQGMDSINERLSNLSGFDEGFDSPFICHSKIIYCSLQGFSFRIYMYVISV